jgi:hypothetical protein
LRKNVTTNEELLWAKETHFSFFIFLDGNLSGEGMSA